MDSISYETVMLKNIKDNIYNLGLNDKNIELKVIIIHKVKYTKKKNNEIYTFLVADKTASVYCNFYNNGNIIEEGDILYISGYYNSLNNNILYLNEGKDSNTFKLGKYFYNFNCELNISEKNWQYNANKKGLKFN